MSHLAVVRELQSSNELSVMSYEDSCDVIEIPLIPHIVDYTKYNSDDDVVNACSPFGDYCYESFEYDSDDDSDDDELNTAVIYEGNESILLDLWRSQDKAETLHCLNKKRRRIQCRIVGDLLQQVTEMIKPIK